MNKNRGRQPKVFVAMSGGVDSSVAAALLCRAGFQVIGVFIRVWEPPASLAGGSDFVCRWREDRRDAMRVAARLNIPLATLDLAKEYRRRVVDYMIDEYRAGLTPNPDIECNRQIKFGAFFRWARRRGADFVATGHYARLRPKPLLSASRQQRKVATKSGFGLFAARDKNKDQTYFLWTLTQKHLRHCLFPIGDYRKPEVRRLARRFGLSTAEKKDSQGLCFIGQLDIKKFLRRRLPIKKGKVIDGAGRVIGWHSGAWFFTIGERHGFVVDSRKAGEPGPYYVIDKDIRRNVLKAAPVASEQLAAAGVHLVGVNWIAEQVPDLTKKYTARIRHRGKFLSCRLEKAGKELKAVFERRAFAPAPGQSLVLYRGEECLGGGIISKGYPWKLERK